MAVLIVLLLAGVAAVAGLAVVFKLLVGLVLLPFKILGALFKAVAGLFGMAFGVVHGLLGLVFGLIAVVVGVVLLPLLPLVILGGVIWLAVRAARPRPIPTEVRLIRG